MSTLRGVLFLGALVGALSALGQPDVGANAEQVLQNYLQAVKAKKWKEVRALTHPKTLEAIAQRKKRTGKENHPMAPWAVEKTESYLTHFKVEKAFPGAGETFVLETSEDVFQVQEKGVSEGEMASYLVGKSDGRWYVADKKRQETFNPKSIQIGYPGYFDEAASRTEEE